MKKPISHRAVLLLCFSTYLVVYLLRVNFASVLYKMSLQTAISPQRLGLVGSVFFVTYAVGQLVNGYIGDRVSPYWFVVWAMLGTTLANGAVSLSTGYGAILLFWGFNGYCQSVFWGALNRILSCHYDQAKHSMVSTVMSSSMVGGCIISWTLLGKILAQSSWRLYFRIPFWIGAAALGVWLLVAHREKGPLPAALGPAKTLRQTVMFIKDERLYITCLICVCLGLVKESVSLWAPTILVSVLKVEQNDSFLLVCLIPLGNLCGILLSKKLIDRFEKREMRALMILFAITALSAALLMVTKDAAWTVLLIALVSAMSYGCNSVLLSFIPLAYAGENLVSTLIGVFDFSSYIGAAVSSFVLGLFLSEDNWLFVPMIWGMMTVTALLLCVWFTRTKARKNTAVGG